jgi:3-deoxy-D-manno-octulosonic-acid transferase
LLSSVYRYGDIAYIGGGFGAGIHNTLEAAVYGIPVVFGPKYGKFHEAIELLACEGAFTIDSERAFVETMDMLESDKDFCSRTGKNAGELVLHGSGGTRKVLEYLKL